LVVLLTGANGFIGRHLADALTLAGHDVICVVRNMSAYPPSLQRRYISADFMEDTDPAIWLSRLAGVDVVINAVGIIHESGHQTFDSIHNRAPRALFYACVEARVRRVIQISALGADADARSRYHLSKRAADDYLASLPLQSVIVQPSLIYGEGGASAKFFTTLASLPLIVLPSGARQRIQPVHITDTVEAIVALVSASMPSGVRMPIVGPAPLTFHAFLTTLRTKMGLGKAWIFPLPHQLSRIAAAAGTLLPGSLLDRETLDMLERGNTADPKPMESLVGHPARPVEDFIPGHDADTVRLRAQLNWLLPVLRLSIAMVWIVTGIVSFGLYPVANSYALLARVGVTGLLAPIMLYGAALLDLLFGIGTLIMRRRYWLWVAQLSLIVFYTILITFKMPEFWLHPYGPLLKNIPMLAAILLLMEVEKR
jgi:uncharacterized protein YbjT (DUF2867 family)